MGYEVTISLGGNAAEELGIDMVNMDKPQGFSHFEDVLQNSVCLLRNRAVKMCLSDLEVHIVTRTCSFTFITCCIMFITCYNNVVSCL